MPRRFECATNLTRADEAQLLAHYQRRNVSGQGKCDEYQTTRAENSYEGERYGNAEGENK